MRNLLSLIMIFVASVAFGQDATYQTGVYHAQGGNTLVIKSTGDIENHGGYDVESGGTLEVKSGGDLQVESGGSITLETGGILDVDSGADLQVDGSVTIQSGGQVAVQSGADFDIESGGSLLIAGTKVDATAAEINSEYVHVTLSDVSTAGITSDSSVASPIAGTWQNTRCVIDSVTTGSTIITGKINGTNLTSNGSLTFSDSAAAYTVATMGTPGDAVAIGSLLGLSGDAGANSTARVDCVIELRY